MNEQTRVYSPEMQAEIDNMERASKRALEMRRASGEILTYNLDGWVVREWSGGRVERLAPIGKYRNEDFPYPGYVEPTR